MKIYKLFEIFLFILNRSSYEKTELQGQKSPIFPSGKAPISLPMLSPSHAGGSTGEVGIY